MNSVVFWSFFASLFGAFMAYPLFLLLSPITNRYSAGFMTLYTAATFVGGTLFFQGMIMPMFDFTSGRQLYFIYLALMAGLMIKSIWHVIVGGSEDARDYA